MFSVASKLLGVFFFYRGLLYLIIAFALRDGPAAPVLIQLLSAALALGFGFILVFRTDGLARVVGASSEAQGPTGGSDPHAVLRTGIILIGLYVFVVRINLVLNTVSSYIGGVQFGGIGGGPVQILIDSVPVALALVLVFRADRIAALIDRETTEVA